MTLIITDTYYNFRWIAKPHPVTGESPFPGVVAWMMERSEAELAEIKVRIKK